MYKFLLLSFAIFCGLQAEIKIGYTTMPDPRTNQDSIFEWILISQNANDKDCESNEIKTTFQFKNLNDNPERVKLKRHYCSPPNGFDNETLKILNNIGLNFDEFDFWSKRLSQECLSKDEDNGDRSGCEEL